MRVDTCAPTVSALSGIYDFHAALNARYMFVENGNAILLLENPNLGGTGQLD